jgi:hypothetical protein
LDDAEQRLLPADRKPAEELKEVFEIKITT